MPNSGKKHTVDRTRLTWVLALLVASMTAGTVVLGVLEPKHALTADARYLAATYNSPRAEKVSQTRMPINPDDWNWVVVHRVGSDMRCRCLAEDATRAAPLAHFVITPDAEVLVTVQWESQRPAPGYGGKIQIGMQLPPGQAEASYQQAEAMVYLLRYLQARCHIGPGKIFLHSQLSDRPCGPDPLACYAWRKSLLD